MLVVVNLCGCAWLASLYEKPKEGGKSTMQYIGDSVHDLPYGGIVEGIISLGSLLVGGGTVHHLHTRKKKPKHPEAPAAPAA
jgi:hypothetical protein